MPAGRRRQGAIDVTSRQPPVSRDPGALGLTEDELNAWAERERQRREAWLQGPTAEERAAHARQEYERRLAELEGRDAGSPERARGRHLRPREARLAAEGALSLLRRWSRLGYAELLRAGREWEEDGGATRRRRVPLDDDPAERSEGPASGKQSDD